MIPILVVIYSSATSIGTEVSAAGLCELFVANGWGAVTAACTAIFALFHFPCSTSLITIYKETKSLRLTALAFLIPTALGLALCFIIASLFKIFI